MSNDIFYIKEPDLFSTAKPITYKALDNGCWHCLRCGNNVPAGYPINRNGNKYTIRRYVYTLFSGEEITGKMLVTSDCNSYCINPDHLYLVDPLDMYPLTGMSAKKYR